VTPEKSGQANEAEQRIKAGYITIFLAVSGRIKYKNNGC